ncbi:hypothetical protein C0J52_01236, partial [Blattella germanica]
IGRLLSKHGIQTAFCPPAKIKNLLRSVKDDLGLRMPGIYKIPCECNKVYIGQTGRTVLEHVNEHQRYMRLGYSEKSAVAQPSYDTGHRIMFCETALVEKSSKYFDRIIKEAIYIKKHQNNFNREEGFQISNAWLPIISEVSAPYSFPIVFFLIFISSLFSIFLCCFQYISLSLHKQVIIQILYSVGNGPSLPAEWRSLIGPRLLRLRPLTYISDDILNPGSF